MFSQLRSRLAGLFETKTARVSALIALVTVFIAAVVAGDFVGPGQTFGSILIDSPEVYTRERLVNDRFLQDAWLMRQLAEMNSEDAGALQIRAEARSARMKVMGEKGGGDKDSAKPKEPLAPDPAFQPRLSKRDRLRDQVDYRDQIRSLLIENQLDDRHDLGGNSLYMLKFDATVVPGASTRALARIEVRLSGPVTQESASEPESVQDKLQVLGTGEQADRWRNVYDRWLESLRSRLNRTQKDLKQAFNNNELSHNDYARLIEFLNINLKPVQPSRDVCKQEILSLRSREEQNAPLSPEDHAVRKACIEALVASASVDPFVQDAPPPPTHVKPGAYVPGTAGIAPEVEPSPQPSAASNVSSPVQSMAALQPIRDRAQRLDYWLNAYFAGKTVQLVIGISVPESSFVSEQYFTIPALKELINLSFFNPEPAAPDGNVFKVSPRVFTVFAIDAGMSAQEFTALQQQPGRSDLLSMPFTDFHGAGRVENLKLSKTSIDAISGSSYRFTRASFKPVKDAPGVWVAFAEDGLLNFANKARLRSRAFTYAITPKESADTTLATLAVDTNAQAGLALPETASAGMDLESQRNAYARALSRRGTVVGYGTSESAQDPEGLQNDAAKFGWIIGPREPAVQGRNVQFVHAPNQYALAALVSIPSWWNDISLEIETAWIDGSSKPRRKNTVKYTMEIPTDFEPLEATLLDVEKLGPELMESRLDPILLTACRPAAIIIPGRRLWRSTVVTVGYQTADQITVLPDMKGIIAKFEHIDNQASLGEEQAWREGKNKSGAFQINRIVRVWTSQGTVALPMPASIGVPPDCPLRDVRQAVADRPPPPAPRSEPP